MRLVIIGGSDAGIASGLRACELDSEVQVRVLVADRYPNFSICGLPYWLGGEVGDWRDLAHRTVADLEASGLRLRLDTVATAIDAGAKRITVQPANSAPEQIAYDRLVVATGADPVVPGLPGADLPEVHLLHHMEQAFELDNALHERPAASVLIIGAGYGRGMARPPATAHRAALALAFALLAFSAAPAQAKILLQRSMKGIRLGMTVREVRDLRGAPDRISFRNDPIQGLVRVYAYGLTRASFSAGDDARVNSVSTTSRHERTSRGIGVGSARARVARKVPGVRCRVEFGTDHCYVGRFNPAKRVTDFLIGANGRVRRVTVGYVID